MHRAFRAVLAAGAIVALALAALLHPVLLRQRERFHPPARTALRDAPPLVAFTTVALGGFRGIIADFLWLRASRLQDEGRYLEIAQLADWITKLEPGMTEVWAFHAWNMAYNISIVFPDAPDRWRWVNNALRLLKDEGIRYNPDDPMLYWQVGWLYQDKIGGFLDSEAGYYRLQLAGQVQAVLGGGYPDYEELRAAGSPVRAALLEGLGLDADAMEATDRQWGPLDWRLPETHAIHWAWAGRQKSGRGITMLFLDRMIFQSMSHTFYRGKLTEDPLSGAVFRTSHPDILPRVLAAYESAMETHGPDGVQSGYVNLLKDATVLLVALGREQEAARLFAVLDGRFGEAEGAAGVESFVAARLAGKPDQMSIREGQALVEGLLIRSYAARAMGNAEDADSALRLARLLWSRAAALLAVEHTESPEAMFEILRRTAVDKVRGQLDDEARGRLDRWLAEAGEDGAR